MPASWPSGVGWCPEKLARMSPRRPKPTEEAPLGHRGLGLRGPSDRARRPTFRTDREERGPETTKATSGYPGRPLRNDSRWRRHEGPLGVAFLLARLCIRIERKGGKLHRRGMHAAEAAEGDGRRARQGDRREEPAIGGAAHTATPSPRRETRQTVAPERLSFRPLVV